MKKTVCTVLAVAGAVCCMFTFAACGFIRNIIGGSSSSDSGPNDYEEGKRGIAVEEVSIEPQSLTLNIGDIVQLSATVYPQDATYPSVTWSVSPAGVADVDKGGCVTALSAGTAVVTATANNGVNATCEVTVSDPAASVAGKTFVFFDIECEQYSEAQLEQMRKSSAGQTIVFDTQGGYTLTMENAYVVKTVQRGTYTADGDTITITVTGVTINGQESDGMVGAQGTLQYDGSYLRSRGRAGDYYMYTVYVIQP